MNDEGITPTSFSGQQEAQAEQIKTNFFQDKKKLIVITSIVVAVIIATVIAIIVAANSSNNDQLSIATEEEINSTTIDPGEMSFIRNDEYSETLNIYANMDNDMSLESLETLLQKGQVDTKHFKVDKSGQTRSYIATTTIDLNKDYTGYTIEFITFVVDSISETNELATIDDIVYHAYRDNSYHEIFENDDKEFVHYSDGIANSYEKLSDAIEDLYIRL